MDICHNLSSFSNFPVTFKTGSILDFLAGVCGAREGGVQQSKAKKAKSLLSHVQQEMIAHAQIDSQSRLNTCETDVQGLR